jgi:transcription-repair coupling factor (superfamily II helicase)
MIVIPSDELIRSEYLSYSKDLLAQQIYGIYQLTKAKHKIIVLSPSTLYRYFPSKKLFLDDCIKIKRGETLDFQKFKQTLLDSGYYRTNKIDQSLQFAARGDIVDIYSLNYENPIRIEFFDDLVESIRFFDVSTQTSVGNAEEVEILPASLFLLTKEEKENAESKIRKTFEEDLKTFDKINLDTFKMTIEDDIEDIKNNTNSSKNYKYMGYLQGILTSIFDYIDNYTLIVSSEEDFLRNSDNLIKESYMFLNDLHIAGKCITHLSYFNENVDPYKNALLIDQLNPFYIHSDSVSIKLNRPALTAGKEKNISLIIDSYIKQNNRVVCLLNDRIQVEAIKECAGYLGRTYEEVKSLNNDSDAEVIALIKPFFEGFELPSENIVVLTSNELFGRRAAKASYSSKFKEGLILGSYLELTPGDYVVHEYNGIGQFLGIKTLLVDGKHEDYIQIAYAKGDKVYVPLYQFNLIRKYVGRDGTAPRLNNLGGESWKNTKRKIKEKVNDLAERLLDLYQERSKVEGHAFIKDDALQTEFESKFPYELTKDQSIALKDIKEDMESIHPMDRLLCGDVGFGKTEVAFRAAFKAIMDGKQVCLLCPTTLLCKQHYEVALDRFKDYGINICMLSRLSSNAENSKSLGNIANGNMNFVIATHKVLSKKVKFKNLGLLIIDEEQRFGVEQKESIKEKYKNIDILTLSATPIPRTLQSSLVGLKSVSTIETPPKERMPIQTYVIPYDESVVKDLILREIARKGQVFYVFNYIDRIYFVASRLKQLIPDIRLGVIHGQMDKKDIDDVMEQFYSGELDLLLATSIIENGIDVRNANLMLVYDADHFGLSQLYQIKGRVGRGDKMAFAYLMINGRKELNDQAKKRLKSIQDFTELGSGYKIAQRDLLIRGAGDILGPQQAGFIDEVGVDMYIRLLNEAIEEKKTGIVKNNTPQSYTLLGVDAYIPSTYANDEDKIELYQKILEAKSLDKVEILRQEMRDIYGPLPQSSELLLTKRKIDILISEKICFSKIDEYPNHIMLVLSREFSDINGIGSSLFTALIRFINQIKISYNNKMLSISIEKNGTWLDFTLKIMLIIQQLYETYMKVEGKNED